jgi:hypothetical protein
MHSFASRVGRWPLALTLIALTALSTGCAQPTQFSTSLPSRPVSSLALNDTRLSPMRHTISAAELGKVPATSVFEVVSRLRPEFLRRDYSGIGRPVEPVVYIDDIAAGPPWILWDIPVNQVAEIHYVTPNDAFMVTGPRHNGGIIVVRMRR